MRLLLLSCLSGVFSYISVALPHMLSDWHDISDDRFFYLPGVLFAVFVLLPLARESNRPLLRWIGLMAVSVTAWFIAVSVGFQVLPLANQATVLACGVSGSVGAAILSVGSRYLVPVDVTVKALLRTVIAGFLGGCIIGLAITQPRASLYSECLYFAGFIIWQSSIAMSIFYRREPIQKGAIIHGPRK